MIAAGERVVFVRRRSWRLGWVAQGNADHSESDRDHRDAPDSACGGGHLSSQSWRLAASYPASRRGATRRVSAAALRAAYWRQVVDT
jgi:hypothetical protein